MELLRRAGESHRHRRVGLSGVDMRVPTIPTCDAHLISCSSVALRKILRAERRPASLQAGFADPPSLQAVVIA